MPLFPSRSSRFSDVENTLLYNKAERERARKQVGLTEVLRENVSAYSFALPISGDSSSYTQPSHVMFLDKSTSRPSPSSSQKLNPEAWNNHAVSPSHAQLALRQAALTSGVVVERGPRPLVYRSSGNSLADFYTPNGNVVSPTRSLVFSSTKTENCRLQSPQRQPLNPEGHLPPNSLQDPSSVSSFCFKPMEKSNPNLVPSPVFKRLANRHWCLLDLGEDAPLEQIRDSPVRVVRSPSFERCHSSSPMRVSHSKVTKIQNEVCPRAPSSTVLPRSPSPTTSPSFPGCKNSPQCTNYSLPSPHAHFGQNNPVPFSDKQKRIEIERRLDYMLLHRMLSSSERSELLRELRAIEDSYIVSSSKSPQTPSTQRQLRPCIPSTVSTSNTSIRRSTTPKKVLEHQPLFGAIPDIATEDRLRHIEHDLISDPRRGARPGNNGTSWESTLRQNDSILNANHSTQRSHVKQTSDKNAEMRSAPKDRSKSAALQKIYERILEIERRAY